MKTQHIIDKFSEVNKKQAVECALVMVNLIIEDINSETFVNSLEKLKLHEWRRIKTQLNSLLEEK